MRADPRHLTALSLLGKLELEANKPGEAVPWLERAVALAPNAANYLCNLGIAHHRVGALEQAAMVLARAVQLEPLRTEAIQSLGLVLLDRGDVERGLACLRRATELEPTSIALQKQLARELFRARNFDAAIVGYELLVEHEPSSTELSLELAACFEGAGRFGDAERISRRLALAHPELAEAHAALGRSLAKLHDHDGALAAFRRVLELGNAALRRSVLPSVVGSLARLGHLDETFALLERELEAEPSLFTYHSSLVFHAMFSPRYDEAALLELARNWNTRHGVPLASKRQPHPNDRSPERRLRIGYVSPDLRHHVMGILMLPVFRQHDHSRHEIVCYSSARSTDALTDMLQACADEWHDVTQLDDAELAERIRADGIDVLVDLSMHMHGNRLKTFAEKPAPVQMTWAYPGTTGLDAIDYRISDRYIDPEGAELSYSEQTLRLPHTFWCYGPAREEECAVNELPLLENGYVTFGCLNTFMKVNRNTLELWGRVLATVSSSRLLVLAPPGAARDFVRDVLEGQGVERERVDFVSVQGHEQYLASYQRIDVALDTFPYNGHTTSLDAFYMGVPVVTLVGETVVGRAGLCLAHNLGLKECVAHDPDEFVRAAVNFVAEPGRLRELRSGLRSRMKNSPLMDAAGFARDLEGLYRQAWRRWCASPT